MVMAAVVMAKVEICVKQDGLRFEDQRICS